MARVNRSQQVDPSKSRVYHCTSRLVRRASLLGEDPVTGRDNRHRKHWVEERTRFLSRLFLVDCFALTVMPNVMHHVLRIRPDLARQLSTREVLARMWYLETRTDAADDSKRRQRPRPMPKKLLRQRLQDAQYLFASRRKLCSLSYFMQRLNERIAQRANQEDDQTGRFFEGRFKSKLLVSPRDLLDSLVYVDLCPVRAGLCDTLDESQCTSIYYRIRALRRLRLRQENPSDVGAVAAEEERERWLSPIQLGPSGTETSKSTLNSVEDWESPWDEDWVEGILQTPHSKLRSGAEDLCDIENEHQIDELKAWIDAWEPPERASDDGCLPIETEEYVRLVESTCEALPPDRSSSSIHGLASNLERLGLWNPHEWLTHLAFVDQRVRFSAPVNHASERAKLRRDERTRRYSPERAFL